MKTWKSIFKSKQVRKECLYSFLILMGIRLLATIPTPGTNPDYFKTLIHDNSALTFIDAMTGNGLSGMSIMALSITPYITASIMVQLAGVIYPHIHEMEKGMEDERKRIHIITLVLGGFVALMESSMIAISFGKKGLLVSAKWYWILLVMLIWTAGSVVASLAGELIRKKYDFNGSSLILLFNILASYPSDALSVYQTMISEKQIAYKVISSILIVLFVIALFAYTVCLQAAERRIPITHSQKIKGASMKSTLPLKACPGTVVPIIFASSILTFPSMIAAFIGKENLTALKFLNTSYWFQKENFYYSIGAIFYIAMIIGFSFYYAEIIFNPTADDGYQIQKIRTSYADGTETEVESKESDLTQNVVADQSLTLSAEFAEKQEEDTPATVTTPAPVVVTTPEDDKNTAKEDDTKTSADTTTSSSEENVKYNNRLSDVTADWGENEFLKEHLSASDLIELSNGISLFASRSGKVSAGMDGLNSVATAKKGSIVTKNTPIDGNYYFTPIIGSKTKITFGTTDSNYTWDNEFCKNAQYYSKAISNWWAPQADTTNWSNTRSFIPHDGAQGHLYAEYTNVGYYDGSPVNMKIWFLDWQNTVVPDEYKAPHKPAIGDDIDAVIVSLGPNNSNDLSKGYTPLIDIKGLKWIKVKFAYYKQNGDPISLKGHFTMSDLDFAQGFHIQEKVENIYLTQEADDRLVYDPRTDAIWSARSGGESDGGTTPDNSNGWVTYTFEGDSQTVIFYNGGTISNVTGSGGGLKEEGIQKYPDSFYHGEGSKFNGWEGSSNTTSASQNTWYTSEFGYTSEYVGSMSKVGVLRINKTDSDSGAVLKGAKFTVYKWKNSKWQTYANMNWVEADKCYLLNNIQGDEADGNKFKVVETQNPDGYTGTFSQEFTVDQAGVKTIVLDAKNTQDTFKVTVNKVSGNTTITANNGNYALKNAKFEIYASDKTTKVADTYTDENGSFSVKLKNGTYWLHETIASQGYSLAEDQQFTVDKKDLSVTVKEPPKTGTINLVKKSTTDLHSDYESYYLKGAEYGVYNAAGTKVGTIVTDAEGKGSLSNLPLGTYTLKELKAPAGYYLSTDTLTATLTSSVVTANVTGKDKPGQVPAPEVILEKVDAETGLAKPQGAGSLQGAEYTMKYYDVVSTTDPTASGRKAKYTWVLKTDAKGQIKLDADHLVSGPDFYKENGKVVFPVGTTTFQETKAPKGYQLDSNVYVMNSVIENDKAVLKNKPVSKEKPYRGYIRFNKTDEKNKAMANIPFKITSKTTGESHIVNTASDGYIYGKDVNFGSGKGFLYDTYLVEEQSCAANKGYILESFEVTINENGATVDKGTLQNLPKTKQITLTKRIKASDINFKNGDPIFILKLTGTDYAGKSHTYYRQVRFDAATVKKNTGSDGYVSLSEVFKDIPMGDYVATEEETGRYRLSTLTSQGGTVSGEHVTFNMTPDNDTYNATFTNFKYDWQYYTHTDVVDNKLQSVKDNSVKYTFTARWIGSSPVSGGSSVDKNQIEATLTTNDGTKDSSVIVDASTYTTSIQTFPNSSGNCTVTVTYNKDGVKLTATFTVPVKAK